MQANPWMLQLHDDFCFAFEQIPDLSIDAEALDGRVLLFREHPIGSELDLTRQHFVCELSFSGSESTFLADSTRTRDNST